jgi:hypothetical protein
MPSRKVRRRREKLKRHEYEYVVETDEGEEIPLERPADRERESDGRGGRDTDPVDRRGRPLPKPTFQRSLRRTAMFAPFIAIFLYITGGDDLTVFGVILNTLVILAFFLPFSYFVDRFIYNALVRRQQRARAARR